jgi:hypothetical protein
MYLMLPCAPMHELMHGVTVTQKLAYAHGESDASARAKGKPLHKTDRKRVSSQGKQTLC